MRIRGSTQAAEVECSEVANKRDELLKGIGNLIPDSVPVSDNEGRVGMPCVVTAAFLCV